MMYSHRSVLRILLVLTMIIVPLSSAVPKSTHAAPPEPKISWSSCYQEYGFPFECGTIQVPLDYANPNKAAISIALVRLPASDQGHRIGSLFVNPGGPGGSGVDFVLAAGPYLYTAEVRARFDIVGFDPRGIMRSTALRCFGNPKQWFFTTFAFPTTLEEQALWEETDHYLADACEQRGGRIMDHMSTADAARDLDLLRQAVGDEQLNYAGYSYGSYLGNTYANLFPDKVRAVIIDGILDPIAWATGTPGVDTDLPFSTRLRSDAGAMATLDQFFALCDAGGTNCAFAPDSANRFAAMAATLKVNSLTIILPDGSTLTFTYADLISNALGALYDPFSWPSFAEFLASVEQLLPPQVLGARLYAFWEATGFITKRGFPQYPNYAEGFPGVACSDTDNPHNYATWVSASEEAEAQYGYFGPLWTWISSICAPWPGSQASRYTGPFTHNTANPVLIMNTFFDPATRYEGAVHVSELLPNSRLLSVNGWGHTTLFTSQCADQAVNDYLIASILPPQGTVCQPDYIPFSTSLASASIMASFESRSKITPAMVPDTVRSKIPKSAK